MKSRFTEEYFHSCDDKWVVIRKAYDHVSYQSAIVPEVQDIFPHFQLYAALFDECPTMEMLNGIPWANTKYNPGLGVFCTEGSLSYLKKRNYRIIGSSLQDIDIQDQIGLNTDSIFFGSPGDTYNADTVILNAIMK